VVLDELPKRAKARYSVGRFVDSTDTHAVLAFPNEQHRRRCDELRGDVEQALGRRFGRPVSLRLVADDSAAPSPGPSPASSTPLPPSDADAMPDEPIDLDELTDAPAGGGILDQLTSAFPGAELVDDA
jgi:hypothetical protein